MALAEIKIFAYAGEEISVPGIGVIVMLFGTLLLLRESWEASDHALLQQVRGEGAARSGKSFIDLYSWGLSIYIALVVFIGILEIVVRNGSAETKEIGEVYQYAFIVFFAVCSLVMARGVVYIFVIAIPEGLQLIVNKLVVDGPTARTFARGFGVLMVVVGSLLQMQGQTSVW